MCEENTILYAKWSHPLTDYPINLAYATAVSSWTFSYTVLEYTEITNLEIISANTSSPAQGGGAVYASSLKATYSGNVIKVTVTYSGTKAWPRANLIVNLEGY